MRERLYLKVRSEKPQQYSPKWCHSVFKHLQLSFSQLADLLLFWSVESGCTVKTSELINLRKISTFYISKVIKLCFPNNCKSRSSKKMTWIWIVSISQCYFMIVVLCLSSFKIWKCVFGKCKVKSRITPVITSIKGVVFHLWLFVCVLGCLFVLSNYTKLFDGLPWNNSRAGSRIFLSPLSLTLWNVSTFSLISQRIIEEK